MVNPTPTPSFQVERERGGVGRLAVDLLASFYSRNKLLILVYGYRYTGQVIKVSVDRGPLPTPPALFFVSTRNEGVGGLPPPHPPPHPVYQFLVPSFSPASPQLPQLPSFPPPNFSPPSFLSPTSRLQLPVTQLPLTHLAFLYFSVYFLGSTALLDIVNFLSEKR